MKRHLPFFLLLAWVTALLAVPPAQANQQIEPLILRATSQGVVLTWNQAGMGASDLGSAVAAWPQAAFGAVTVPAQIVTLFLHGQVPAQLIFDQQSDTPWPAALPAAPARPKPQSSDGAPRPDLLQPTPLPASPFVMLRDSIVQGERIIVVAVYPLFQSQGTVRLATMVEARIPDATLVPSTPPTSKSRGALPAAAQLAPTNAAAERAIATFQVSQAGMQRVTGAALAAVGIDIGLFRSNQLHVYVHGAETALEVRDGGDNRLDATDEFRFYAGPPGDRWNRSTTYWLTVESTAGQRMSSRSGLPAGAASRTTVIERGIWRDNRIYDSTLAGPQGDHWYATDMKTAPGQPPVTLSVPLTPTLPLAGGSTIIQVSGSAYTSGQHTLQGAINGVAQTARWSGVGNWTQAFSLAASASTATLTLVPQNSPDGLEIAQVEWSRLVTLDFNGRGASFEGAGGRWQYQMANTPANRSLYDVSDVLKPVFMQISPGTQTAFEDGPTVVRYLLSGPGTLVEPSVAAHQAVDVTTPRNGAAVYIAPAALLPALAPLVAHRQAQGYSVQVIDVQHIYDAWSYGNVAPEAIRAFLRYASAAWATPPLAVTLVGDGTADPLNYLGKNNTNLIPPYLAMVDPWIGETACEACYAQLDGTSPLDDLMPDLMLGRLPVKNPSELSSVVIKIIGYETAPTDISWQKRSLFVADNYRQADNTLDPAGDFAALADQVVALAPHGVDVQRVYYDPSPSSASAAYREPNAERARILTIQAISQGAGRVTYIGHSHQWQWAVTDTTLNTPYLFGLYDVDRLTNRGKLPIVLELTCLTGAFQIPAFSGTSIDERLLLKADGGAIAVFSSSGLGVVHGHDILARGFDQALWAADPQQITIGSMVMSSYNEVFSRGVCCQDTLRTFGLMGDPLTRARAVAPQQVFLPLGQR